MTTLVQARGLALPGRLEETTLDLEAGGLVCLVGPNGSGKTSLLHALAGIGRPSGNILVGGTSPGRLAPEQRQRLVSYVAASRDVTWPLKGRDLIGLAHVDEAYLPLLVDALELGDLLDRRVDRLSTGERSRILIARGLAPAPRLLLLDEPAANLDPLWQLRLMELLRAGVRERSQAALVAVHDLDLACAFADRLLIMDGGAVVADGEPSALLDGPAIPRVFGIERVGARWRPIIRPPEGPRSSR